MRLNNLGVLKCELSNTAFPVQHRVITEKGLETKLKQYESMALMFVHSLEDVSVAVLKSGLARKDFRQSVEKNKFSNSKHSLLAG